MAKETKNHPLNSERISKGNTRGMAQACLRCWELRQVKLCYTDFFLIFYLFNLFILNPDAIPLPPLLPFPSSHLPLQSTSLFLFTKVLMGVNKAWRYQVAVRQITSPCTKAG